MGDNNVGQGRRIRSVLVANRSEIAIRVMRAATELGLRTIGIYSHEDRFALHRTKADESYLVGQGQKPLQAYLDIAEIIRVAKQAGADAIHPGYGFLSENPELPRACAAAGIAFIGPTAEVMTRLGNKVAARITRMAISERLATSTDRIRRPWPTLLSPISFCPLVIRKRCHRHGSRGSSRKLCLGVLHPNPALR